MEDRPGSGVHARAFEYYPALKRVDEYVHGHLAEPIGLHRIAGVAHLEPKYFSRFFHHSVGLTFTEWLAACRVERAAALLRERDWPVAEVAANHARVMRVVRTGWRMALAVAVTASEVGCGDPSGPDGPPAGLMVAGGQNAAFPGDTFPLTTWFTETGGLPLGVRPPGVGWTSSDTTVVAQVRDSLFVARALGTCVLTAEVAVEGATFTATLEFHVIPPLSGRWPGSGRTR